MDYNVTVIIPSYNRIEYLPRCINSIYNQTYAVKEIILVDNNSKDGTKGFIKEKYSKVRVINEKKRGVSFARNLGIIKSTNNWIAFIDSDDEWLRNKIEKQISLIKKSNNKIKLVHTDEIWIKNGKILNQKKKHTKYGGYIFKNCLDICKISPSSVLINKYIFKKYGLFDTKLKVCEDYDLWLRLTSRIKVGYVDEVLLKKYGGHKDQLSRKYWGLDRYRIKSLEKIILNYRVKRELKNMALKTLLNKINIIIKGSINRKNKKIFKMYLYKKFLWEQYNFKFKKK